MTSHPHHRKYRRRIYAVSAHAAEGRVPSMIDGPVPSLVEGLERRVLLSGYALTTLAQFVGGNATGSNPNSALVMDGSGNLYGTTNTAGPGGFGTVFEIDHATGAIITLASDSSGNGFGAGLVMDASGNLYGTTASTVFELSKGSGSGWTLTTLATAAVGYGDGGLVMDTTGNLYGTTYGGIVNGNEIGTVFELSKGNNSTWTLSTLDSFDGTNGYYPRAMVLDATGNLYGVTDQDVPNVNGGGTVFELSKGSGPIWTLSTLVSFSGREPGAGLALDASGNLYGTTDHSPISGGANDYGTVFELSKGSGSIWTLNTLASFEGLYGMPTGTLLLDGGGNLYGSAGGTVFELSNRGSSWALSTLASFGSYGLVMNASGNLYGTTYSGGANDAGTVFELSKGSGSSWSPSTLASFDGPGPAYPQTGLTSDSNGNLYGTTSGYAFGGPSPVIFELSKGSGSGWTLSTLASFDPTGEVPYGPLVTDASGNLYGTARARVYNYLDGSRDVGPGTVFELPKGSTTIDTLASFDWTVGPDLVMDAAGNLYGAINAFGDANGNVVAPAIFELSKGGGSSWAISKLASLDSNITTLQIDASGNLYGTTSPYDVNGNPIESMVFELSKGSGSTWALTALASFDRDTPGNLLLDASGDLYGIAIADDINGNPINGTVFELLKGSWSAWTLTTLASVNFLYTYQSPELGGLVVDASGNLYGTIFDYEHGAGSVYELSKGSGSSWALTTLASFDLSNGPEGNLILDSSGNLYGTNPYGGDLEEGAVFELVAQPSQIMGTVWADTNHNGIQDSGESGLAGVTVFLDLNGDGKLDPGDPTTMTDANGNYTFTGLHPSTYTVRQVLPDGYAATAPRGYSETVRLGAGENATGPNFGDVRISSVTLGFDYLLLIARNYGQAGTFADGDLNGDGKVDFDDLLLLAKHYGRSLL